MLTRTLSVSTVLLASASLAAQDPPLPTAAEVLARHRAATGLAKPRTTRFVHTVRMIGMPGGQEQETEMWFMAPDKIRIRTRMPMIGLTETVYDGKIGWTKTKGAGGRVLEGPPLAQLRQTVRLVNHELSIATASDSSAAVVSRDTIEGRSAIVLVSGSGGIQWRSYYDPESWLLIGMRGAANTPADSAGTMLFGDYKRIDGVLEPMTMTVKAGGQSLVTRTTVLEHKPIKASVFELDKHVKGLLASSNDMTVASVVRRLIEEGGGAFTVVDSASLANVTAISKDVLGILDRNLGGAATIGTAERVLACTRSEKCVSVRFVSWDRDGNTARTRAVIGGVARGGRCAASREATYRMRVEEGVATIDARADEDLGSCGR